MARDGRYECPGCKLIEEEIDLFPDYKTRKSLIKKDQELIEANKITLAKQERTILKNERTRFKQRKAINRLKAKTRRLREV